VTDDSTVAATPAFSLNLPLRQSAAVLVLGVVALLVTGIQPILLGALAQAGRLDVHQIGRAAMAELLAMGLGTVALGAWLDGRHLRWVAVVSALVLAGMDLLGPVLGGEPAVLARGVAGLAEGALLWITIGLIVRQAVPERWAAVFFGAQTAVQLAAATALSAGWVPGGSLVGGFGLLVVAALVAVGAGLIIPPAFPALPRNAEGQRLPDRQGWIALAATAVYVAGGAAVWIYMGPLASQGGLNPSIAGLAVSASLAGQVFGAVLANLLAGRIGFRLVIPIAAVFSLIAYATLSLSPGALAFAACFAVSGLAGNAIAPYLAPMIIEADPTRRAAVLSGGAQLLGSAFGPLAASLIVREGHAHGALAFAMVVVVCGVGLMFAAVGRRR
jgi:DHA1 family inner membrane transport protein